MKKTWLLFFLIFTTTFVYAKDYDVNIVDVDGTTAATDELENVGTENINKSVDQITQVLEKNVPASIEATEIDDGSGEIALKKSPSEKIDYSNLRSVQFSDSMAIVQKSILDKSGRIQWHLSGGLVTTETYYRTFGLLADFTYHMSEFFGVKLFGYVFEASGRDELNDLEKIQSLSVQNLIHLKNYSGIATYWNPIYGKMTLFNEKIIQYDTFFNLGAGYVNTKTSTNTIGIHGGLGNLYTLSDSSALRFDLNWVFYKAINLNGQEQDANSIVLTVGYSGFFLEGKR